MSNWYKMDPVSWNEGTNTLTLEQEAAYLRICNAIYIAGEPIAFNKFVIGGLLRCNERKAKRLLDELVAAGKLEIDGCLISNPRAIEEISNRNRIAFERESAGRRGGIESGKSRANPLKNHETDEASASSKTKQIRVDKNKIKEEPNGSSKSRGGRLSADWVPDELFARSQGLSTWETETEAAKFRDYWAAQPGQRGVKTDWDATWRNWVRKAAGNRKRVDDDPRKRISGFHFG